MIKLQSTEVMYPMIVHTTKVPDTVILYVVSSVPVILYGTKVTSILILYTTRV